MHPVRIPAVTRRGPLLPWARNPLLRTVDRLERLGFLLAALVLIAALPIAALAGWAGYQNAVAAVRSENAAKTAVTAVVLSGPEPVAPPDRLVAGPPKVRAEWTYNGRTEQADVTLTDPPGPGERAQLWLDRDNRPTNPPAPAEAAVVQGAGTGLLALLASAGLAFVLVTGLGALLDRHRAAAWDREWAVFDAGGQL